MTTDMNLTRVIIEQIKEIDARDESQMMSELAGETVQEMFYTTEVWDRKSKRTVKKVKLSWAGIKDAARSKGNIVVDDIPFISELEDGVRIVVKVTDLARNFTVFGGCHQPRKMKVNDDNGYHLEDDPYYFQKGLSKAQRNAFQAILPADLIAKCVDRFVRLSTRPTAKSLKEPARQIEPTKAESKAKNGWESVTKEMIPDYPSLEKIFWDITKKQPKEMYAQLGVNSRTDLAVTAWDAFLQLKEALCPVNS